MRTTNPGNGAADGRYLDLARGVTDEQDVGTPDAPRQPRVWRVQGYER